MERKRSYGKAVFRDGSAQRGVTRRVGQRGRELFIALRLVSVLLVGAAGIAETAPAQTARLSVRPHEMATATRTARAGKQTLDGKLQPPPDPNGPSLCGQGPPALVGGEPACYNLPTDDMVYVPEQCVGARRCPLVVLTNAPEEYFALLANKHGILVAQINEDLDRGLQEVLRTFAVDPDKIVIAGRCATGDWTVGVGAQNLDVFSRVVVGTQHTGDPPVKTPTQTNEYYISGGLMEHTANFWGIRQLRERGYAVKYTLQFRGHSHRYEDYDFIGHWLQESWAIPNPAARPAPYAVGPLPRLTLDVLAHMTAFWTRFQQEPESIRTTARQALVREVAVAVGTDSVSTLMVDMPALAARYPSVAGALQAAQLTPQQHEAYRVALASAHIYASALANGAKWRSLSADSVRAFLGLAPSAVVVQNSAFLTAHPDEAAALEATNMWTTP